MILENTLPFSSYSAVGQGITLQGVELGHVTVPLQNVNLIIGPVIVGVRPSLLIQDVSLILGNDTSDCQQQ